MASLYKKPVTATDPDSGERVRTKSQKWWGQYKDALGRLKRVPLAVDKMAAATMLNDLVRKVERTKAGLVDPTEDQRKRPLAEHIREFKSYQANKGVTAKQVAESTRQFQKMIDVHKWKFIGDITADGVLGFLGQLRRDGLSIQTYNHYLKSAKAFCRWLVRDRRTPSDPLLYLSRLNVRTDRRHDRRALSTDEFDRLLKAARAAGRVEDVPGPDRAMLYVLAAWTGFRKGELGSLTLRSLKLDADPPQGNPATAAKSKGKSVA